MVQRVKRGCYKLFASDIKDKLINELNAQIEDGTFYTMNDLSKFTNKKDDVDMFDSIGYEHAPAFSGLAKITGFDFDTPAPVQKNNIAKDNMNSYFDSLKIDGSSLYRPMVSNFSNPLEKSAYTYKPTFDLAVNGMAFLSKNGGIVENPLAKNLNIVNNLTGATVNTNTTIAKATNPTVNTVAPVAEKAIAVTTNLDGYKVEPIAMNTYNMLDILNEAGASEELIFNAIPKEYALTTVSKWNWRNILFKEVDILGGIKKIFSKQKSK